MNRLTKRQAEIYGLIIRGYTNEEIANSIFIAYGTVKLHVHSILKRLGLKSRIELMAKEIEKGTEVPHKSKRQKKCRQPT
jgi:two-component system NarL family response regulator